MAKEAAGVGASERVLESIKREAAYAERKTTSLVFCTVFNASSAQGQQWTRSLAPGEHAAALAVGGGWVACATDRGLVRVFGLGGLETDVFHLPGPVVALAGSGRRLLAVCAGAAAVVGDARPQLSYQLLDVPGRRRLSAGALPLHGPGASLAWAGFAEPQAMPCIMDGAGLLSGLSSGFGGCWVPLFNSRAELRSSSDKYWPVAVLGGVLSAVLLKSKGAHPTVFPRPLVATVPLRVPGAEADKVLGEAEGKALTAGALKRARDPADPAPPGGEAEAAHADLSLGADRLLLKLMQAACAAQRFEAALDACRQLSLPGSFDIAVAIANHASLASLAPRVEQVRDEALAAEEGPAEEDEEAYYQPPPKQQQQQQRRPREESDEPTPPASARGGRISFAAKVGAPSPLPFLWSPPPQHTPGCPCATVPLATGKQRAGF